jgi:hypothetical protein
MSLKGGGIPERPEPGEATPVCSLLACMCRRERNPRRVPAGFGFAGVWFGLNTL